MTLAEFIRDNPSSRLILLWFDKYGEIKSVQCYSNKLTEEVNKLLGMEVMDYNMADEEEDDWMEVWLR